MIFIHRPVPQQPGNHDLDHDHENDHDHDHNLKQDHDHDLDQKADKDHDFDTVFELIFWYFFIGWFPRNVI